MVLMVSSFVWTIVWCGVYVHAREDFTDVSTQQQRRKNTGLKRAELRHQRVDNKERGLQNSNIHAPIRIRFDIRRIESRLGESQSLDAEIFNIINQVLPFAASTWSSYLSVLPVEKGITLHRSECEINELTEEVFFPDADLVIIVGGDDAKICVDRQLAYSTPCTLNSQTDRPVVGEIEFCLNQTNIPVDYNINGFELATYYQQLTGSTFRGADLVIPILEVSTHEMGHVLGFSPSLFPYFRDENGNPMMARNKEGKPIDIIRQCGDGTTTFGTFPSDNIVRVVQVEDGSFQTFLVTPKVQAIARNHFNCSTLLGGRLDDSISECIASHWHERHYMGELMSPKASSSSENSLSLITLGLLEDSGWYQVNYRGVAEIAFGIGAGCGFVTEACINKSTDRVADWVENEFCDDVIARFTGGSDVPRFSTSNVFCDPAYRSWTLCDLVQSSGGLNTKSYFSDLSLRPFFFHDADNCPVPAVGLGLDCRVDAPYNVFYQGESVGQSSRCINAFYGANGSVPTFRPACIPVTCDVNAGVVRIGLGEFQQNCTFDGQKLPALGQSNACFVCPRLAAVCPEIFVCPDGCFGRGECVYSGENATLGAKPYCRCFDTTNTDLACAPPYMNAPTSASAWIQPQSPPIRAPSAMVPSPLATLNTETGGPGSPTAMGLPSIILPPAALQPVSATTQIIIPPWAPAAASAAQLSPLSHTPSPAALQPVSATTQMIIPPWTPSAATTAPLSPQSHAPSLSPPSSIYFVAISNSLDATTSGCSMWLGGSTWFAACIVLLVRM